MIAELPFDACCDLRGFDGLGIFMKMDAKIAPKMNEKSSLGRPRADILRFRGAFWGGRFFMHFRWAKSGPKIRKNAEWEGKRQSFRRPGGMRGGDGGL